ncbi:RNA/RNP complex-1-interacting phosphatase [Larimichthys crocea]|uniref:RNA/RNP complex-1-interacting phosphatase n=1 Tax=Larimichthys crocea TaxID=215358 RepID=UPI000901014B|nr:RNA/RNP complex-1-interacting phosphatase [Larimichthys crocea]
MSRHGARNGVPDRWLDYRAVGKRLPGTRFVAFKVPLKQSLNRQLSRSDVFGPWELLDALNREKQELGLIIDLTFTSRYYEVQDVPESLLFVKIFTAGHAVPSDDTILSFKRAVRRFLRDNVDNDKLIGVHCTHGLNRTGYLICRYLIDVDGMDPKEAVELFNSSRGHAIERENYLDDLQRGPKRSNDGMEDAGQEPKRGHAARRPSDSDRREDRREDRRPHYNDSRNHRSSPPRRTNHRSYHHGLLPSPPLQHPPPMRAPLHQDHHPYRWTPPHADAHWRRPSHSEDSRSRYRPAERDWSPSSRRHEDRRRAPPPPPPLPRYSVRWTNESNGMRDGHDEEWAGRPMRSHRFAHRVDTYDNY